MGFFDSILRGIEEIQNFFRSRETDEEGLDNEFRRKYVSGLFYCNGKKRQLFGITFEQNDTDREDELLDAIDDKFGSGCSDIRSNNGYSDSIGIPSEADAIYPEIEVGSL